MPELTPQLKDTMQKDLHAQLIRNFEVNIEKMRRLIIDCRTIDQFQEHLSCQDEWFMMHPQYTNPDYEWYWHEDGYADDVGMQSKEIFMWEIALKKAERSEWASALFI